MNRNMFMTKLRELLSDLFEAEREEALSYYEEYFEDAGVENEESVIASLGTPEKVAATIDDEVKLLIDKAYEQCSQILKRDEEKLHKVVDFLMEHETMSGKQFKDCMTGNEIGVAEENSMFQFVDQPEKDPES